MRGRKRHRKKYQKQRLRVRLLYGDTIEAACAGGDTNVIAVGLGPHPSKVGRRHMRAVVFKFNEGYGCGVWLLSGVRYWVDIVVPGRGRGGKGLHLAKQVNTTAPQCVQADGVVVNLQRNRKKRRNDGYCRI